MKTVFKIIAVFILLLLVYAVVALLAFGKTYHYEKSMVIHVPQEKVWQHIHSMKAFNEWNPWMKLDPAMRITYTGDAGKKGDAYCWNSARGEAGAGCQQLLELIPYKKQKSEMIFKEPFEGRALSVIMLTPEGRSTKVTWTMETEQHPMMKIMRPFMDYQMGKSYGEGLENLKRLAEKP